MMLTLGGVRRQQRNIVQLLDGALGCNDTGGFSRIRTHFSIMSFYCRSTAAYSRIQHILRLSSFRLALQAASTYQPGGPWRN